MRLKILDAAISLMEQGGEAAIRLRTIASAVGITEPTLYHYFRDREDLVIAAHTRRLKVNLAVTINPFLAAIYTCTSREEFLEVLLGVYRHSYQRDRVVVREVRMELIGASIQREKLREEVVKEINASLEGSVEAINFAKEQGWLRPDIDSRAFTLFNLSVISSLVFPELQRDDDLLGNWKDLAIEAISSIVMSHEPTNRLDARD